MAWPKTTVLLPDFLVIGAMKAGTTTLYGDLARHPDVFVPATKEPGDLCHDEVLTEAGRNRYGHHYHGARPEQRRGDFSTSYSAVHERPGVPARAKEVLGPDLRIIYVVREPLDRIRSHLEFFARSGLTAHVLEDDELRASRKYVNQSMYGTQLGAWLEVFPPEQVYVVPFEAYVLNRAGTLTELLRFLDIDDFAEHETFTDRANVSTEVAALRYGAVRSLLRSDLYRRYCRRVMPQRVSELAKRLLMRSGGDLNVRPLSPDLRRELRDELKVEVKKLCTLTGWAEPPWEDWR